MYQIMSGTRDLYYSILVLTSCFSLLSQSQIEHAAEHSDPLTDHHMGDLIRSLSGGLNEERSRD
jgi:hypothetical protein